MVTHHATHIAGKMAAANFDADAKTNDTAAMLGMKASKKQTKATPAGFRCSSSGESLARPAYAIVDGMLTAKSETMSEVHRKAGALAITTRAVAA